MRWSLLLSALCVAACGPHPEAVEQPNLLLIVGDDLAYTDLGFMGSPHVETPNLDRLASEGTVFPNGYVTASVCTPSLRSLLTGLHPYQWNFRVAQLRSRGIRRGVTTAIRDFTTLPGVLAEHGYQSFQGGKLWEESYWIAGFTHGIQEPGDETVHGGVGVSIGRTTMVPVYRFLDLHGDRPFFLWFAPQLPHFPHDAPEKFTEPYRESELHPDAIAYYANIRRFDAVVGELLAYLSARGLRERTLIAYLTDNGWDQRPRENSILGPYAGHKGKLTMHELGFRTPIVLSWPGRVPEGVVRDELVSSVDLFPTFLDYAGVPQLPDRPGRSLRPLLEGTGSWERDAVIGGMSALRRTVAEKRPKGPNPFPPEIAFFARTARWHYVWNRDLETEELYDVRDDPREERNLAAEHPEVTARMRREIEDWKRRMRRPFELRELPEAR